MILDRRMREEKKNKNNKKTAPVLYRLQSFIVLIAPYSNWILITTRRPRRILI